MWPPIFLQHPNNLHAHSIHVPESTKLVFLCSQVLTDLVQGEFMQLGSKETENERFAHYLTKTYRKTASLTANSLKAVSLHDQFHSLR